MAHGPGVLSQKDPSSSEGIGFVWWMKALLLPTIWIDSEEEVETRGVDRVLLGFIVILFFSPSNEELIWSWLLPGIHRGQLIGFCGRMETLICCRFVLFLSMWLSERKFSARYSRVRNEDRLAPSVRGTAHSTILDLVTLYFGRSHAFFTSS